MRMHYVNLHYTYLLTKNYLPFCLWISARGWTGIGRRLHIN